MKKLQSLNNNPLFSGSAIKSGLNTIVGGDRTIVSTETTATFTGRPDTRTTTTFSDGTKLVVVSDVY